MRPALSVLSLSAFAACTGPNANTVPLEVNWMEWPAQVVAAREFGVRLVLAQPFCTTVVARQARATVDNSAVTFEPFALVRNDPRTYCASPLASPTVSPVYAAVWDTTVRIAGLAASYARTYELRATASVAAPAAATSALPERTFGSVTVRLDSAPATRANAGGIVWIARDSLGCTRVTPQGLFPPQVSGYVVENPDTALRTLAFVRGYLYYPAAPLCGAARVFHLVSAN
jgi:hypothetical protein